MFWLTRWRIWICLVREKSRDHHVHIGMVWFRTTQYVTMISAERWARGLDWQWSQFSRSLLCLYCMDSWWTRYHNDRWWLRSRSRCSRDGAFSFFFCEVRLCTITIHALSRQVMTTTHLDLFELQIWRTWWLISWGFLCEVGGCRCYVWIVWYRDEHHTNGDRHDGSHPRVLSVTMPVIAAWLQSRSQCWTLLYLFCLVRWWTPYHHDLWGTRSPKRLVVMSIVVIGLCGLVIHIHSHDTWWTLTPEVSVVMIAVVLCYLLQLNRPPSSMREICSAWSRDD